MKATVNEDCIGCGMCAGFADGVFDVLDDGVAHCIVDEIPADMQEAAQEACDQCPVEAIEIED